MEPNMCTSEEMTKAALALGSAVSQHDRVFFAYQMQDVPHYEAMRILGEERDRAKLNLQRRYIWSIATGMACGLSCPHWVSMYQFGFAAKPFVLALLTGLLFAGGGALFDLLYTRKND